MELYLMNESKGLTVLENFVNTLEQFGIAYAIGGSMASSIYGNVRFTQDADITVEPFDNLAEKLIDSLKNEYYVSEQAVHQALRQKGSFNAIHIESAFKIDIFIQKDTAFEKQLIARRKLLKLSDMLDKSFSVVSPVSLGFLLSGFLSGNCLSSWPHFEPDIIWRWGFLSLACVSSLPGLPGTS